MKKLNKSTVLNLLWLYAFAVYLMPALYRTIRGRFFVARNIPTWAQRLIYSCYLNGGGWIDDKHAELFFDDLWAELKRRRKSPRYLKEKREFPLFNKDKAC